MYICTYVSHVFSTFKKMHQRLVFNCFSRLQKCLLIANVGTQLSWRQGSKLSPSLSLKKLAPYSYLIGTVHHARSQLNQMTTLCMYLCKKDCLFFCMFNNQNACDYEWSVMRFGGLCYYFKYTFASKNTNILALLTHNTAICALERPITLVSEKMADFFDENCEKKFWN
jgi:hypothetical protein